MRFDEEETYLEVFAHNGLVYITLPSEVIISPDLARRFALAIIAASYYEDPVKFSERKMSDVLRGEVKREGETGPTGPRCEGAIGVRVPDQIRKTLSGNPMDNDRLWLIHTPKFSGAITEYNWELTGLDQRLGSLHSEFRYGGNAYYILNTLCKQHGWKFEAVEDRR